MTPDRRWFQFSLRSCLILTTAVCVWLGWKADSLRAPAETEEEALAAIEALGGEVVGMNDAVFFRPHEGLNRPMWMKPDTSHIKLTDDGMRHFRFLKRLTVVGISEVSITDAGLARLHGLKNLTKIVLSGTKVTPKGIAALQKSVPDCEIEVMPGRPVIPLTTDLTILPPLSQTGEASK